MSNNTPLINLIMQLPESRVNTPTYRTISNNIVTQVENLIQQNGNSINELDSYLNTPLHWAVIRQHGVIMRLLIFAGADVNARNTTGDTPLHWAVFPPGNIYAIEHLLEFNADNTIRNSQDATPLELAENILNTVENVDFDHYQTILTLLEDHIVTPTPALVQEYPEFAESPFWMKYNNTEEVDCSICTYPLVDGTQVCLNANCEHGFHCNCIRPWLQRKNTCPLCRAPFVLRPLGEIQQRALENSFGKKRNKLGIKQLNSFKKYLDSL